MLNGDNASWFGIAGITIGGLFMIIKTVLNNKALADKGDVDGLEGSLKELKDLNKELKHLLRKEREARGEIEGKYENFKFAFRVAFNEYEIKFKNKPELLSMLKDLRDALL